MVVIPPTMIVTAIRTGSEALLTRGGWRRPDSLVELAAHVSPRHTRRMAERPWFQTYRTSFADPVLHARIRRLAPHLEAPRISGCVFDLVTASCGLREAVQRLDLGPDVAAALEQALETAPSREEVQSALIASGREGEARALSTETPMEGGEFEAHRSSKPRPPPPRPQPPPPPPTSEPDVRGLYVELAALRSLVEAQRDVPALMRAMETRMEQQSSLLRLLSFALVAGLVALVLIGLR